MAPADERDVSVFFADNSAVLCGPSRFKDGKRASMNPAIAAHDLHLDRLSGGVG